MTTYGLNPVAPPKLAHLAHSGSVSENTRPSRMCCGTALPLRFKRPAIGVPASRQASSKDSNTRTMAMACKSGFASSGRTYTLS